MLLAYVDDSLARPWGHDARIITCSIKSLRDGSET